MPSVLFLSRWYPPHSGHFIRQIAEAVSPYANVVVLVVVPDSTTAVFTFKVQYAEETEYCLKTIRISYHHFSWRFFPAGLINLAFYQVAQIRGLIYCTRQKINYDLIHSHVLTRNAIVPLILKLLFGKPYIITEYWTRYLAENNDFHGWLRKKSTSIIARNADRLIAISGHLKKAMEKNGIRNRHFCVIPPAINTQLFTPAVPVFYPGKKRFIHISTFSNRAKNVRGILKTIGKLSGRRSDFECHFIGGEAPFLEETISFAKELGLYGKYVFFRGVKFDEELVKEIHGSNFLVMFSNYETFSVVIQECLSCGKPVVASKAGPIPGLVDKDSGILVDTGNEDELLDAIDFMLDHYQNYDSRLMHEKVQNSFGYNIVGKAYAELYESVLEK